MFITVVSHLRLSQLMLLYPSSLLISGGFTPFCTEESCPIQSLQPLSCSTSGTCHTSFVEPALLTTSSGLVLWRVASSAFTMSSPAGNGSSRSTWLRGDRKTRSSSSFLCREQAIGSAQTISCLISFRNKSKLKRYFEQEPIWKKQFTRKELFLSFPSRRVGTVLGIFIKFEVWLVKYCLCFYYVQSPLSVDLVLASVDRRTVVQGLFCLRKLLYVIIGTSKNKIKRREREKRKKKSQTKKQMGFVNGE